MTTLAGTGVDQLVERIDRAVGLGSAKATAAAVKHTLSDLIRSRAPRLPEAFCRPRPESYARRLLHRDPATGWTAVVMTWGPGQGPLLHDHAGLWCVEGVVSGEMEVLQYEVTDETEGRWRTRCWSSCRGPASAWHHRLWSPRSSRTPPQGELLCVSGGMGQPDHTARNA